MTNPVLKKLESVCKKCSSASIKVYWNNIKRLFGYHSDGEVEGTTWLFSKKVKDAYEKQKLGTRRHLSTAGFKLTQAFKSKNDYWEKRMELDSDAYSEQRGKNEKSDIEKKKWVKGGFKVLKKAAAELWKKTKRLVEHDDKPNLRTLYKFTQYILIRLYSEIPLRNTFASFSIKPSGNNNYIKNPLKGNMEFVIRDHKSSKKTGEVVIKPSRGVAIALRKYLNYRKGLITGDHVFSGIKGNKLSKGALGKLLHRTTKDTLGKAVGSRMIRVMAVTSKRESIEEVRELANNMLHTSATQKSYVRKD